MASSFSVVDLVTSDDDKKYEPAGRMAATIIEIIQKNGRCKPRDLNEMGFCSNEVIQHWHMAYSLAAVELDLMNNGTLPNFRWNKPNG